MKYPGNWRDSFARDVMMRLFVQEAEPAICAFSVGFVQPGSPSHVYEHIMLSAPAEMHRAKPGRYVENKS
eukprot:COSAG03_NODE_10475_length_648_cov_17.287818_1_plen_70_part_01